MGSIALPRRRILGGPRAGDTIEVTTPDHVLIHLEFASGALGQLLASFATVDTLEPWLELHLERGAVSFGGKSWDLDPPVMVHEATPEGWVGQWTRAAEVPRDDIGAVEAGARHFIRCLAGEETPALTAEHARHVLEVILASYESIADGRTHELRTTFEPVGAASIAPAPG
jgi:predicted dehydrogenase